MGFTLERSVFYTHPWVSTTALLIATAALIFAGTSQAAGPLSGDNLECAATLPAVQIIGKESRDGDGCPGTKADIDILQSNISVLLNGVVAPCLQPTMPSTERCNMTQLYGIRVGTGQSFNEFFGCHGVKITGFEINHGEYVEGLQFFYEVNGTQVSGNRFLPFSAPTTENITLGSDERIASISGRLGHWIDQLTFVTNQGRQFGPFGALGGDPFEVTDCYEPRGIFGHIRSSYFDQLGFYCAVKP